MTYGASASKKVTRTERSVPVRTRTWTDGALYLRSEDVLALLEANAALPTFTNKLRTLLSQKRGRR